jgi:two-component system sensor histidine kinase/response regulator
MEQFTSSEKSAFIRALGESVSDVVFFKAPDGTFQYANHAFERLYGYTLDQISGKTDYAFLTEEEAAFFAERDREAMQSGKPTRSEAWQMNELTGERECYETVKTPVLSDEGRLLGLLGVSRNITHKRTPLPDR